MSAPEISIVIPTCNRPAQLVACLRHLVPQLPDDGSVECLACDDGRDDASRRALAEAGMESVWRQGPRHGPAANRNHGARLARGRWLLFLDDDCEPRPGFFAAYRSAILGLSTGARVALEGATHAASAPLPSLLWEAPHNPEGGTLISCNFAMPRELFFEVGGFDERFSRVASFEDTEFAARIGRLDIPVRFVREAAVDHPLRPLPPAARRMRRWESRVISTYDFGASTRQLAWRLPRHIIAVTISRFRGQRWSLANLRAGASYAWEVILAVGSLPRWIARHRVEPRSAFWLKQVRDGKAPPRFGL